MADGEATGVGIAGEPVATAVTDGTVAVKVGTPDGLTVEVGVGVMKVVGAGEAAGVSAPSGNGVPGVGLAPLAVGLDTSSLQAANAITAIDATAIPAALIRNMSPLVPV